MRAVRVHELGGPEVLRVDDIEVPEPGPGEVRVRIEAAGVNFIDTYHREGKYPLELPATIGGEGGGVVDAVGRDVPALSEGDRVAFAGPRGAYAEMVVVPARAVVPVPGDVEVRTAAAALLQGMTAHYVVHDTYPVGAGDTVLVHAAAGGAGHLPIQMCKLLGARVIATCGTQEKADLVRGFGADEIHSFSAAWDGTAGGSRPRSPHTSALHRCTSGSARRSARLEAPSSTAWPRSRSSSWREP